MAFKQRTEEDKRVSWEAVWNRDNVSRTNRKSKGTEVEDLASLRNRKKSNWERAKLVQESIGGSKNREGNGPHCVGPGRYLRNFILNQERSH